MPEIPNFASIAQLWKGGLRDPQELGRRYRAGEVRGHLPKDITNEEKSALLAAMGPRKTSAARKKTGPDTGPRLATLTLGTQDREAGGATVNIPGVAKFGMLAAELPKLRPQFNQQLDKRWPQMVKKIGSSILGSSTSAMKDPKKGIEMKKAFRPEKLDPTAGPQVRGRAWESFVSAMAHPGGFKRGDEAVDITGGGIKKEFEHLIPSELRGREFEVRGTHITEEEAKGKLKRGGGKGAMRWGQELKGGYYRGRSEKLKHLTASMGYVPNLYKRILDYDEVISATTETIRADARKKGMPEGQRLREVYWGPEGELEEMTKKAPILPIGEKTIRDVKSGKLKPSDVFVVSAAPRRQDMISSQLGIPKRNVISIQEPSIRKQFNLDQTTIGPRGGKKRLPIGEQKRRVIAQIAK